MRPERCSVDGCNGWRNSSGKCPNHDGKNPMLRGKCPRPRKAKVRT